MLTCHVYARIIFHFHRKKMIVKRYFAFVKKKGMFYVNPLLFILVLIRK